jgi:glutamyl-tRNA synthetase
MSQKIVTRFAPSPTGLLHVGGARTALFSYFFARRHGGEFLLRIEDTDTERSKKEYEQEILDSMKWLGLEWDRELYYQSKRFDIYRDYARQLLKSGHAYKCYCTPADLDEMRKTAEKAGHKPMYDRRCRDLTAEKNLPYVLRLKVPLTGTTVVSDLIHGDVTFDNKEIDDFIILRSNDTPTYNFTVVVDDIEMKISHVIRGDDHLNNTPKQILIMQAFKFSLPFFAHVPMILGPDKVKLSKRHGAVAVTQYRELGYLPEALVNHLIRLGWSHGDQEIFTKDELIKIFDLAHCGKSASVFEVTKLDWINNQHIQKCNDHDLLKKAEKLNGLDFSAFEKSAGGQKLFKALKERTQRLSELKDSTHWFLNDQFLHDPKAVDENLKTWNPEIKSAVVDTLKNIPATEFTAEKTFNALKGLAQAKNWKIPQVAKPVRVALTGTLNSPDLGICMEALGPGRVIERLTR